MSIHSIVTEHWMTSYKEVHRGSRQGIARAEEADTATFVSYVRVLMDRKIVVT